MVMDIPKDIENLILEFYNETLEQQKKINFVIESMYIFENIGLPFNSYQKIIPISRFQKHGLQWRTLWFYK